MSNKPHGTAIICERVDGATVAWVDERLSREVPAGYFVDAVYGLETEYGPLNAIRVGTMQDGYAMRDGAFCAYFTFGEAVQWCWRDKTQRERQVAA